MMSFRERPEYWGRAVAMMGVRAGRQTVFLCLATLFLCRTEMEGRYTEASHI